jgi:magnesium transporter
MTLDRSHQAVFVPPPAVTQSSSVPASVFFNEGRVRRNLSIDELRDALKSNGQLWVDIDSQNEDHWQLLSSVFRFHSLPIEDTRSERARVKIEEYDRYLFIGVREVRFNADTPDPYDLNTVNLSLFLGHNFLVTVHALSSSPVRSGLDRCELDPLLLERGVEYVAHLILDEVVDCYFPLLDEIESFTDELEEQIHKASGNMMPRILDLKRTLLALRRQLAPTREVMATLATRSSPYIDEPVQVYFRDVYDHVVRQMESVEMYRELLLATMDVQLAVSSHAVNEVVKRLTVVTTVVLPATLIAGIFGMNFERSWIAWSNPDGFTDAMLIMGVVSLLLLVYMAYKKWI